MLLRKYTTKSDSERVIAAILDSEVYESTDPYIKQLADHYFRFAPDNQ